MLSADVRKCRVVAANNALRNDDRVTPPNRSDEKLAQLREMTEALTALGNYLAVAQHECEKAWVMHEMLGEALRKSLGQFERAAESVRQLRQLLLPDHPNKDDRPGDN